MTLPRGVLLVYMLIYLRAGPRTMEGKKETLSHYFRCWEAHMDKAWRWGLDIDLCRGYTDHNFFL